MTERIIRSVGVFILLFLPLLLLSFWAYTVFHQILVFLGVVITAGAAFYFYRITSERDRLNQEVFQQSYELKKSKEALEACLVTDAKTHVYNSRLLSSRLTEECDRARRYRRPLSCLLISVDSFTQISQTHGPLLSEVILQEIAQFLKANTRSVDIMIKSGEDRFVGILPETQLDQARIVAERIRYAIEKNTFRIEGKSEKITVSIGFVSFDPAIHRNKDDLMSTLEQALSFARKKGPNRISALGASVE